MTKWPGYLKHFLQISEAWAAFTINQTARGAAELRDMIVDAWKASEDGTVGYPPIKVSDVEAGRVDPYPALRD